MKHGIIPWVVVCIVILGLFRPIFLGKTLFPANLLMSVYAPWKYQPVSEYPHGPPNKPIGFDNIRQFYPNRELLKKSLSGVTIPLWNPYIYSGTPFMAAFDTAVWYPISWIAASLPDVWAWNFLVVIQPVFSLLFMYLFLRSLKFDPAISVFGAFAWAFSGWMVVYWQEILVLEHSILWLPLALYASNRMHANVKDKIAFLLLVFSLVNAIFAGFMQMAIYVYLVVFAWNAYIYKRERKILFPLCAMLLALCITAIQLIPSAESYFLSPRGTVDGHDTFEAFLLPLKYMITFLAPDFWGNPGTYSYFGGIGFYFEKMIFIGIVPLALALYALLKKKEGHEWFFATTGLIALSMGFAFPTSWLPYYLHIPVLSNSYPTRIFSIATFSLVILACFGLRLYLKSRDTIIFKRILVFMVFVLGIGWVVALGAWCAVREALGGVIHCPQVFSIFWKALYALEEIHKNAQWYASVTIRNLIVPTAMLFMSFGILAITRFHKSLIYFVVLVLTVLSGFYFANKYLSFSEVRFIYPTLPVIGKLQQLRNEGRIWGYGDGFIEKNIAQHFEWYSPDGYGNLSPKRYAQLLSTIVNKGMLGGAIKRSDTDLFGLSESDAIDSNPYRLRLMTLLGVRYIVELKKGDFKNTLKTEVRFPNNAFAIVWEDDTWRVWEYKHALPLVRFAGNVLLRSKDQEIIDAIYDESNNLNNTVILEEPVSISGEAKGTIRVVTHELNFITATSSSDGAGFVVWSDNDYPGWEAYVDGVKVPIYRADYTFKAVKVEGGEHEVVFRYNPQSFHIGGVISIIALMLTLILFALI